MGVLSYWWACLGVVCGHVGVCDGCVGGCGRLLLMGVVGAIDGCGGLLVMGVVGCY